MKGVPLRIEIGPRDIRAKQFVAVRRDTGEKKIIKISKNMEKHISEILEEIQSNLYRRAKKSLHESIKTAKDFKELKKLIQNKKMVKTGWCGNIACEEKIQEEITANIRLIPLKKERTPSKCVLCEKKAKETVYISKAY